MNTDEIGCDIYSAAGLVPGAPLARGAVDLAVRLFGRGVIVQQPHAIAEGDLATFGGRKRIVIRRNLPPRRANFVVAVQIVRLVYECTADAVAAEDLAAAAAWLVAPPEPFRATVAQVGVNLRRLAATWTITETSAALRVSEVGGPDTAVVTPDTVHRRGRFARVGSTDDLRSLATMPSVRAVRRVEITDEPGRVALLAS